MKNLIFVLITLLFASCIKSNLSLENDNVVTEVFSTEEIKELKVVLKLYDKAIRNVANSENTVKAYHSFLESLKYNGNIEELHEKMSVLQPTTDSILLFLEDSKVFKETFIINYAFTPNTSFQDTVEIFWDPLYNGKYYQFLDKLYQVDKKFNDYKESLEASGSISPSLLIAFPLIHKNLDIKRESIRLVIGLHYLFVLSNKNYK